MKRMMMFGVVATTLLFPVAANAQTMSIGTFLTKVEALKSKGMLAVLSPDVKLIKSEMKVAATQMKAEADARKAAGKPPLACPPTDKNAKKMAGDEFLSALKAIPPEKRGMSVKDGLSYVLVTKYPCHKG